MVLLVSMLFLFLLANDILLQFISPIVKMNIEIFFKADTLDVAFTCSCVNSLLCLVSFTFAVDSAAESIEIILAVLTLLHFLFVEFLIRNLPLLILK